MDHDPLGAADWFLNSLDDAARTRGPDGVIARIRDREATRLEQEEEAQ